jgi:hypothetical protein
MWKFLQINYGLFFQILIKLEYFRQIFGKSSNIKLRENLSSGYRIVSCGQTDRQTEQSK